MSRSVDLAGRVVAITGGARGIGRATAEAFVRAGAHVCIGDLDAELAAAAAEELGGGAIGTGLDVRDTRSFEAFLDTAEARLGPLDVLVNNAGVMLTSAFVDEDDATMDRSLDVNLRGVLVGSRLAAQRMVPRGRGHIVNIASQAGRFGFPGAVTYCATKYGVLGASEALDAELHGTGVVVRVILPAAVNTELAAGLGTRPWSPPDAEPEDVADAILLAVSSRRFAHGVPRVVTGALTTARALPYGLRTTLLRLVGSTTVLLDPDDPGARSDYLERARSGR